MTEKKPGEKGRKGGFALDMGLGGIFKGLGDFLEVVSKMSEAGEGETTRTGEFEVKGVGQKGRGVYGFSVRSGIGGIPQVERFGNIKQTTEGPKVADVREPLVDLFDEEQEIVLVAELPGVAEDEVKIDVRDDVLSLSTTGDRKYEKEILLSAPVDESTLRKTFKNGILEAADCANVSRVFSSGGGAILAFGK